MYFLQSWYFWKCSNFIGSNFPQSFEQMLQFNLKEILRRVSLHFASEDQMLPSGSGKQNSAPSPQTEFRKAISEEHLKCLQYSFCQNFI